MSVANVYELPSRHQVASEAKIIDGREVAERVRASVASGAAEFAYRAGRRPGLATILVGDDPASAAYVAGKHRAASEAGIETFDHRLLADVAPAELEALVHQLNADDAVDGVLCQLPLPGQLDGVAVTDLIDPRKDVDGLTTLNAGALFSGRAGLVPCTPAGVVVLLQETGVEIAGRHAVVLGRSNLFGKPMAQMLLAADATVTVAHRHSADVPGICRTADILIAAVGRAEMVKAHWVKSGATVIDVGISRTGAGLCGDVDFEAVRRVAAGITPVPGGVGPMTVAMLLRNTLTAAEQSAVTAAREKTADS